MRKEAAAVYEFDVLWSGKYYQYWENESHSHGYYQIIAALKGGGRITVGGQTVLIREHGVFLIRPHAPHSILLDEAGSNPQLMDIKFNVADGALAQDLARLPVELDVDFFTFQSYFDHIMEESARQDPYSYDCVCHYFGLALAMLLRSRRSRVTELPGRVSGSGGMRTAGGVELEPVIQFIQQNYISPINLDDLSRFANVSKSTLIQAFKTALHTTPIKYINSVRITKAKELLLSSNYNISEISEMVGFQSLHYFSRYFKNRELVSPVEYRQRYSSSHFYTYRQPIGEVTLHNEADPEEEDLSGPDDGEGGEAREDME